MKKNIKITQIRSSIGRLKKHKSTLICLGLKRIGNITFCKDNPSIRGMIRSISYMVKIERE